MGKIIDFYRGEPFVYPKGFTIDYIWGWDDDVLEQQHDYKRISRILRSLKLLGLGDHADAFHAELLEIYATQSENIGKNTLEHWNSAVAPRGGETG
jgi:hypothetical protein